MKHIRLELPARRYNLLLEYPISYESGYEKTFFQFVGDIFGILFAIKRFIPTRNRKINFFK